MILLLEKYLKKWVDPIKNQWLLDPMMFGVGLGRGITVGFPTTTVEMGLKSFDAKIDF